MKGFLAIFKADGKPGQIFLDMKDDATEEDARLAITAMLKGRNVENLLIRQTSSKKYPA